MDLRRRIVVLSREDFSIVEGEEGGILEFVEKKKQC